MNVLDRAEQLDLLHGENVRLREELRYQWQYNHSERRRLEWPHPGKECYWPIPAVLADE